MDEQFREMGFGLFVHQMWRCGRSAGLQAIKGSLKRGLVGPSMATRPVWYLEWWLPKRYVCASVPEPCECGLIWKRGLC